MVSLLCHRAVVPWMMVGLHWRSASAVGLVLLKKEVARDACGLWFNVLLTVDLCG